MAAATLLLRTARDASEMSMIFISKLQNLTLHVHIFIVPVLVLVSYAIHHHVPLPFRFAFQCFKP